MSETYTPKFLSWATSLEHEISEIEHLISCEPEDVELLKKELRELKDE